MIPAALALLLLACSGDDPTNPKDSVPSDASQDSATDTDAETPDTDTDPPDDSDAGDSDPPVEDTGLLPFEFDPEKRVSMAGNYGCAMHPAYGLQCWGSARSDPPGLPRQTDGVTTAPNGVAVTAIGAGIYKAVAIAATGELLCWPGRCDQSLEVAAPAGADSSAYGVTLDPSSTRIANRFGVLNGGPWVEVTEAGFWFCGRRADGQVDCGGDRDTNIDPLPSEIGYLDIDGGENTVCGITFNKEIHCQQDYDEVCLEATRPAPRDWAAIRAGNNVACAIDSGGYLACWGGGPPCLYRAPDWLQSVPTTGRWVSADASAETLCAMKMSGKIRCWGNNRYHQADGPAVTIP